MIEVRRYAESFEIADEAPARSSSRRADLRIFFKDGYAGAALGGGFGGSKSGRARARYDYVYIGDHATLL
jgi:hypothetical protein